MTIKKPKQTPPPSNRRGYQTSDFAAGQTKVPPNPQGGANDGDDTGTGNGGYVGTSSYQSGPLANDPPVETEEAKKLRLAKEAAAKP